jgi:hypothetical protein
MLLLVTELIAVPVASHVMERIGPNHAFALMIPIEICTIPILFFIKETLVLETENQSSPVHSDSGSSHSADLTIQQRARAKLYDGINATHSHLMNGVLPLLRRRVLLLALAGFFVNRLTRPVLTLLLQYASVKFSLRISQVSTTHTRPRDPTNGTGGISILPSSGSTNTPLRIDHASRHEISSLKTKRSSKG